jgi:hypothetical protein
MSIRDISELSETEKLDFKYYQDRSRTDEFMSERAIKIWEHFQKKPFTADIKIDDITKKRLNLI